MPRRPDQNHYSHKVNILVLPVDENEVRNAPPSRQAEDKARAAREAKLMALAMQEKERRKNQDPCETARGPFRKTETPSRARTSQQLIERLTLLNGSRWRKGLTVGWRQSGSVTLRQPMRCAPS